MRWDFENWQDLTPTNEQAKNTSDSKEITLKLKSNPSGTSATATGFMLVFLLFWTALVLLFDSITSYSFYHQIRTTQFQKAAGTILSSEVETSSGSDSDTYRPLVKYRYSVNGETFTNDIVRYGMWSSNDSYAYDFVAAHPAGKQTDVFYDADNPGDAVLIQGLEGADLFLITFLTPFNIVMIAGWWILFTIWAQRFKRAPCKFIDDGYDEVRILVNRTPLRAVAGITLMLTSFISIFVVAFGLGGFHAPMHVMLSTWGVIFLIVGSITAWFASRNWSGRFDIVASRFKHTLTLPPLKKRKKEVTVGFNEIDHVSVERSQIGRSDDSFEYLVQLVIASDSKTGNKTDSSELLTKYYSEDMAFQFANWFTKEVLKRDPAN